MRVDCCVSCCYTCFTAKNVDKAPSSVASGKSVTSNVQPVTLPIGKATKTGNSRNKKTLGNYENINKAVEKKVPGGKSSNTFDPKSTRSGKKRLVPIKGGGGGGGVNVFLSPIRKGDEEKPVKLKVSKTGLRKQMESFEDA